MARTLGFSVLALAAVLIWFFMAPSIPSSPTPPTSYATLITAALSTNAANEDLASSAPQQQVTNGWVARDLLEIQAKQMDDLLAQTAHLSDVSRVRDDRIPALLAIAIMAICWHGVAVVKTRTPGVLDSPSTTSIADALPT